MMGQAWRGLSLPVMAGRDRAFQGKAFFFESQD